MRPLRIAVAVLMLAGMLVGSEVSAEAGRSSGGCQSTGSVAQVGAGDLGAFAGYMDCEVPVKCPKKHKGECTISLKGTVTGTGVVGLVMVAADEVVGECSEPEACEVAGKIKLAPGATTDVACSFGQGAAANVAIDCRWSSR